jgi:hypothetical protein
MQSRPGSRVVLQVAGTVAAAVIVVAVFGNLRSEPSPVPAGESTQVRGIAASELRRDVVSPTPTAPAEKPIVAADAKREARKPAPRKPHEPAAAKVATVEPAAVVDPGPPLPLAPPPPVEDSFVSAAGKTSLAVLRTSTDFVTSTVPKAVVSTTRDALGKAKSFGTAVLDKVTP